MKKENIKAGFKFAGIFLVIFLALGIRFKDGPQWQKYRAFFFYQNHPNLLGLDSYYYLRLAKELKTGTYKPIDEKRCLPELAHRPKPPPLISVLTAGLGHFFPLPWVAFFLSSLLSSLIIIPYFLWGRQLGNYLTGFMAATLGVSSFFYYYRTQLGWFDTDCLNVFFILIIPYFFYCYYENVNKKRYLYLFLTLIFSMLFCWWWMPAKYIIVFLLGLPFLASVFFYKQKKSTIYLKIIFVCVLSFIFLLKYHQGLSNLFKFIAKEPQGTFPNIAASISELGHPKWSELARLITGNLFGFFVGIIGILSLWRFRPRQMSFLVVPLGIGLLCFFSKRFCLFFIPFISLGIAYICWSLGREIKERGNTFFSYIFMAFLFLLVLFSNLKADFSYKPYPKYPSFMAQGLSKIKHTASKDAAIWCWWDIGYLSQYWSNRGTFIDGGSQKPQRTYFTAFPLTVSNERLAAQWIRFFLVHGESGFKKLTHKFGTKKAINVLKTVLSVSKEQARGYLEKYNLGQSWLNFFFPQKNREVYLVLDRSLIDKAYWWYYFGTWDIKTRKGHHASIEKIPQAQFKGPFLIGKECKINLITGMGKWQEHSFNLKALVIINLKKKIIQKRSYGHTQGFILEIAQPYNEAFLVTERFYHSLFNRLFVLNLPSAHFVNIYNALHAFQVWKVRF